MTVCNKLNFDLYIHIYNGPSLIVDWKYRGILCNLDNGQSSIETTVCDLSLNPTRFSVRCREPLLVDAAQCFKV